MVGFLNCKIGAKDPAKAADELRGIAFALSRDILL